MQPTHACKKKKKKRYKYAYLAIDPTKSFGIVYRRQVLIKTFPGRVDYAVQAVCTRLFV